MARKLKTKEAKELSEKLDDAKILVGTLLESAEVIAKKKFGMLDKIGMRVVKLSVAQMLLKSIEFLAYGE